MVEQWSSKPFMWVRFLLSLIFYRKYFADNSYGVRFKSPVRFLRRKKLKKLRKVRAKFFLPKVNSRKNQTFFLKNFFNRNAYFFNFKSALVGITPQTPRFDNYFYYTITFFFKYALVGVGSWLRPVGDLCRGVFAVPQYGTHPIPFKLPPVLLLNIYKTHTGLFNESEYLISTDYNTFLEFNVNLDQSGRRVDLLYVSISSWVVLKRYILDYKLSSAINILGFGYKKFILENDIFYPHMDNVMVFKNLIFYSNPVNNHPTYSYYLLYGSFYDFISGFFKFFSFSKRSGVLRKFSMSIIYKGIFGVLHFLSTSKRKFKLKKRKKLVVFKRIFKFYLLYLRRKFRKKKKLMRFLVNKSLMLRRKLTKKKQNFTGLEHFTIKNMLSFKPIKFLVRSNSLTQGVGSTYPFNIRHARQSTCSSTRHSRFGNHFTELFSSKDFFLRQFTKIHFLMFFFTNPLLVKFSM